MMKKKLYQELQELAQKILESPFKFELSELQIEARSLYEKLSILKFMEDGLSELEINTEKSDMADHFKDLAGAVLFQNTTVPENNPHEEDIITPGIDTIRDMVSEMPILHENPDRLKTEDLSDEEDRILVELLDQASGKMLNGQTGREIEIVFSDSEAKEIVEHLFLKNETHFKTVLYRLQHMADFNEARNFLLNQVKPLYDNWQGKADFEEKLLNCVGRSFAVKE